MFTLMMQGTKALLIVLWGMALLGLIDFSPLPAEYQLYVLALAGVVLLVHFVEYFALKTKVLAKNQEKMNFIQTMLWGYGYWLPLLKRNT